MEVQSLVTMEFVSHKSTGNPYYKAVTYVDGHGMFQAPEKNTLLSKDRISIPVEPHSNFASVFRTSILDNVI